MTHFTATNRPGRYTVAIVSAKTGREMKIRVRKTEELNPSARGGAYKTVWFAEFAFSHKTRGETRQEAYDRLMADLAASGYVFTETGK